MPRKWSRSLCPLDTNSIDQPSGIKSAVEIFGPHLFLSHSSLTPCLRPFMHSFILFGSCTLPFMVDNIDDLRRVVRPFGGASCFGLGGAIAPNHSDDDEWSLCLSLQKGGDVLFEGEMFCWGGEHVYSFVPRGRYFVGDVILRGRYFVKGKNMFMVLYLFI